MQGFILRHCIRIGICHFRLIDREIETMTVIHINIERVIHTAFGINQNNTVSGSCPIKCSSSPVLQDLYGFYFFHSHICQSACETVHQHQRWTGNTTHFHTGISTPSGILRKMQSGNQSKKWIIHSVSWSGTLHQLFRINSRNWLGLIFFGTLHKA